MTENTYLAGERILVVARSTTAHHNAGGMETSSASLVSALQTLGAHTALVTTQNGRGPLGAEFQGHRQVWELATRRPGRYSRDWWSQARWGGPWQNWRPTMILGEGDSAAGFTLGTRSPVPVVVHCHGTTLMEAASSLAGSGPDAWLRAGLNLARTPSRWVHLRRADAVITAGTSVDRAVSRFPFFIQEQRKRLVANSVDPRVYSFDPGSRRRHRDALGVQDSDPVYLSVGRLAADKGVDLAVSAVLARPTGHILIVGDGPERPRLEDLSRSLGGHDRVHFVGRTAPEEVPGLMSASDQLLFVTRRREAGGAMVLLEAAANGLPVVTTQRAGTPGALQGSEQVAIVAPAIGDVVRELRPARADVPIAGGYLPAGFHTTTLAERTRVALGTTVLNARS